MKFTIEYVKDHKGILILQIIFAGIYIGMFYLYQLPIEAVLLSMFICFLLGIIFFVYSLNVAYQKHKRLLHLQVYSGDLLETELPERGTTLEKDYHQIIQKLCLEKQKEQEKLIHSQSEIMEYFTMWIHQIKIPITSMQLYLEEEDSNLSRKLKSNLLHIKQYVEMVLTYIRLGSESTDYVFRKIEIDKIVRENIQKLRGDFIMKKIELQYEQTTEIVLSDEKWLSFVIEQILSNALKYTREGFVMISMEESKTLCIRDTGIGINKEDIPRIFEKGYTGVNGRNSKQASGIGLYLCKKICDRLGHEILVESEIGRGTTVRIRMNQNATIV